MVNPLPRIGLNPYRILQQSLGRHSVPFRGVLSSLIIMAVTVAFVGNIRFFVDRTAIVNADTTALQVTFDERKYWLIEQGMTLCRPPNDLRTLRTTNASLCNEFTEDGTYYRLAIDRGDRIEIRVERNKNLLVRFMPCVPSAQNTCENKSPQLGEIWPSSAPNGFLVIPMEALREAGRLSLSGKITIGGRPGSDGGPDFLIGGVYQIREQNWLTRTLGRRSTILETGDLIPGASVELVNNSEPSATTKGHLFHSTLDDLNVIKVIALSAGGYGAIKQDVAGVDPFTIDPDWVDSVIANPIFLALAFLLGIVLNTLQIASSIFNSNRRGE